MKINQSEFFDGLDATECIFEFGGEEIVCYKGTNNDYFRIDHFSNFYVIEYAENEEEAKLNRFEDSELYNDSLPKEELINQIQTDLKQFMRKAS